MEMTSGSVSIILYSFLQDYEQMYFEQMDCFLLHFEQYFLTCTSLYTEPPSPYLEDSGNEVNVLPGQRELKVAAVQGIPQVPNGPKSGRLAQYILGPRALLVQEAQHVLDWQKLWSFQLNFQRNSSPRSSPGSLVSPHHDRLWKSALRAHGAEWLAEQAAPGHTEGGFIELGGGAAPKGPGDEGVPPF